MTKSLSPLRHFPGARTRSQFMVPPCVHQWTQGPTTGSWDHSGCISAVIRAQLPLQKGGLSLRSGPPAGCPLSPTFLVGRVPLQKKGFPYSNLSNLEGLVLVVSQKRVPTTAVSQKEGFRPALVDSARRIPTCTTLGSSPLGLVLRQGAAPRGSCDLGGQQSHRNI